MTDDLRALSADECEQLLQRQALPILTEALNRAARTRLSRDVR